MTLGTSASSVELQITTALRRQRLLQSPSEYNRVTAERASRSVAKCPGQLRLTTNPITHLSASYVFGADTIAKKFNSSGSVHIDRSVKKAPANGAFLPSHYLIFIIIVWHIYRRQHREICCLVHAKQRLNDRETQGRTGVRKRLRKMNAWKR